MSAPERTQLQSPETRRAEHSHGGPLQVGNAPVSISKAAQASGVSAKMVRHYESLGLLGQVGRTDSGYRQYTSADVHTLRFIKRARTLGFSMAEIAELVSLWRDRQRASAHVKQIAQRHVAELQARIEAMQAMRRTLQSLLQHCHGDERPDCPILDDLANH
ncbi:Cu(I)-responsive transcriptional regulator [Ottowia caeni]|uniref:Cu(I)-responsive transcriptional regulator n=1 Tax=Ottowia caeni TaxID=2870339 RepID=UPI003D7050DB|nr:Cu(I)-responsive transcriptional regulator [Ottowia caeni]